MAGRAARSARVAGHFGELIQGRLGPEGPVVLVTLPCSARATFCDARLGPFELVQPAPAVLAPEAARALLRRLGLPDRGRFRLVSDLPPGGGAGASTAARVALARAAARFAGCPEPAPEALARACVESEGASDPLMFAAPERLLWSSRTGEALARLPPLPGFEVLGGFFGAPVRTDPADTDFADVSDLLADWPRDAAALASESARRLLARRAPGDPTEALAAELGAEGFAVAHTGSARALLFAPGRMPGDGPARLKAAGFAQVTRFGIGDPCSPSR